MQEEVLAKSVTLLRFFSRDGAKQVCPVRAANCRLLPVSHDRSAYYLSSPK